MSKTTKAVAMLGMVAALGVAALPLSAFAEASTAAGSAADVTKTVGVKLDITESLTMTTETTSIDLTDEPHEGTVALLVTTNASSGYTLNMKGDTAALTSGSDTIPAISELGVLPSNASAWGYSVTSSADETVAQKFTGNKYAPVQTTDEPIIETEEPTDASGETISVKFKAAVQADQAAGSYTNTITFTATTNE